MSKRSNFLSQLSIGSIIWCGKREKYLVVCDIEMSTLTKIEYDIVECNDLNEALNIDMLDGNELWLFGNLVTNKLVTDLVVYYSHFMAFDTLVLCPYKNHYATLNEL